MDTAIAIIQYGAPWVLAVMGAVVAVKPPPVKDRKAQFRWIAAFVIVGTLVTVAQVCSDARDRAAQKTFEAKLTGADNYCYFQALLDKPQPGGGFEWQLSNKEQRPIPNIKVCLYRAIDGKDQFIKCWEEGMCVPHSINQMADEGPIMSGKHRFIFFAANTWEQTLEITKEKEGEASTQRGIIYRDGKEIWRFPTNGAR